MVWVAGNNIWFVLAFPLPGSLQKPQRFLFFFFLEGQNSMIFFGEGSAKASDKP